MANEIISMPENCNSLDFYIGLIYVLILCFALFLTCSTGRTIDVPLHVNRSYHGGTGTVDELSGRIHHTPFTNVPLLSSLQI